MGVDACVCALCVSVAKAAVEQSRYASKEAVADSERLAKDFGVASTVYVIGYPSQYVRLPHTNTTVLASLGESWLLVIDNNQDGGPGEFWKVG